MGKHSEVFVAFDVAKKKHAVAIAERWRAGEVRFLGDVENSPLADRADDQETGGTDTTGCMSALRPGRPDTGFIARVSRLSATPARWPPSCGLSDVDHARIKRNLCSTSQTRKRSTKYR